MISDYQIAGKFSEIYVFNWKHSEQTVDNQTKEPEIRSNTSTSPIIAKTRIRNSEHTSLISTDSSAISPKIRRHSSLMNRFKTDLTSIDDCASLETKISSRTRMVTSSTLRKQHQISFAIFSINSRIKGNTSYAFAINVRILTIDFESESERGKFPALLKMGAAFSENIGGLLIWRALYLYSFAQHMNRVFFGRAGLWNGKIKF